VQQEGTAITQENNVLVTKSSHLVAILLANVKKELITIDSDNLFRIWNLRTGLSNISFSLDIE
jgi:hypothetical protein